MKNTDVSVEFCLIQGVVIATEAATPDSQVDLVRLLHMLDHIVSAVRSVSARPTLILEVIEVNGNYVSSESGRS